MISPQRRGVEPPSSSTGVGASMAALRLEIEAIRREVNGARMHARRKNAAQALRLLRGGTEEGGPTDLDMEELRVNDNCGEAKATGANMEARDLPILPRVDRVFARALEGSGSEEENGNGDAVRNQARKLKGEAYCLYASCLRGIEDSQASTSRSDSSERILNAFGIAVEADGNSAEVLIDFGVALRGMPKQVHRAVEVHRRALRMQPSNRAYKRELACSLNDFGTYLKNNGEITEQVARAALDIVDDFLYSGARSHSGAGSGMDEREDDAPGSEAHLYERIYKAALAVEEGYAASWYNMGVAYGERGDRDKATKAYLRAISHCPDYTEALCNYGALLRSGGDLEGAVKAFERSLKTNPNHAMIRANLAATLCELGAQIKVKSQAGPADAAASLERAIRIYERALSLEPKHPLVLYNLGVAYSERGEKHKALAMYELALCFAPTYAEAWNNLGVILRDLGNVERAVSCYKEAVKANPQFGQPLNNLGIVYAGKGEVGESLRCFRKAIAASPGYAEVYNNLGVLYRDVGMMNECLEAYNKCLDLDPKNRSAGHNLLMGLNYLHCGQEEVVCKAHEEWGRSFAKDFREALPEMKPVSVAETSPLSREHSSSSEVYHVGPGEAGEGPACFEGLGKGERDGNTPGGGEGGGTEKETGTSHDTRAPVAEILMDPEKKLVVGYISPDLFTHSVSYFAEAPITHHTENVRVIVYNVTPNPDDKTEHLKRLSPGHVVWRDVAHLSELSLGQLIRKDKVDILVELTGHTANNRLGVMAMKAAPVQATWIGYPNSTGLREVDYRITDWITDPEEGTRQTYVETLERLPGCFLCYTPSTDAPEVAGLPALETGSVTFGTFNALAKVTDEVVEVWAKILKCVPTSRLLIKSKPFLCPEGRRRMVQVFEKNGIHPSHFDLIPLVASTQGHLDVYGQVDIGLDPWPYAGTTTTCEALYMGVPTITLKGRCHAQNVGWTLLDQVGLAQDFCADSPDQYVAMAQEWATEKVQDLAQIRRNLRERMMRSPLCKPKPFVHNLETVYRKWWRKLCHDSCSSEESSESAQAMADT